MKKKILLTLVLCVSAFGVLVNAQDFSLKSLGFIAPQINDKSNVYAPAPGEIIYDSSDSTFYGRTQSSTWVSLGSSATIAVPAGAIVPYAGTTAPSGYLMADGSAVSRTTYAALFAAIGTSFGSGDGSTTFNLPDLRGKFMRGVSGSSGIDPDASSRIASAPGGNTGNNVGTLQADAFQGHHHKSHQSLINPGSTPAINLPYPGPGNNNDVVAEPITDGVNGTPRTASETRPVNINVNYLIKY